MRLFIRSSQIARAHRAYVYRRLGGGKSLLAGEDTPNARRAFADPRAHVSSIAASSLQLTWVRSRANGWNRFCGRRGPQRRFYGESGRCSVFTEADTLDELRGNVRSAVERHFDEGQTPQVIRLHIVCDEISRHGSAAAPGSFRSVSMSGCLRLGFRRANTGHYSFSEVGLVLSTWAL